MEEIVIRHHEHIQSEAHVEHWQEWAKESNKMPGYLISQIGFLRVRLHILLLAWRTYGSLKKALSAIKMMQAFKSKVYGGHSRRKFRIKGGQYFFGMYIPPFPSKNFDRFVLTELNRYMPHSAPVNAFQQINFAITTHCPMQCEHCFEWDNLNHKETFSLPELQEIVKGLQKGGVGHISLSGGEPMVRFDEMVDLVSSADKHSEWWMLTSGFNLSDEKARILKKAGLHGIAVSMDHYEPEAHNLFRGHKKAFAHASQAIRAANRAGLATAISVCVTRSNANKVFLTKHAEMCRALNVDFIQWFEPKSVGHYAGKDVELHPNQIKEMEAFYIEMNFDKALKDFPPIIYHGYYQRRIGCLSGGKFSFYIDAAGMVHSCPFCHSNDGHIMDWLQQEENIRTDISTCQVY